MPDQIVIDVLGADPQRPWPGIARDVSAASAGAAELTLGRSVVNLGRDPDSWPVGDHGADVVFAPLGLLSASSNPVKRVKQLGSHVREGGLCVTEELSPPGDVLAFIEPVFVEVDHVVLAAVEAERGCYEVRFIRFDPDGQSVSVARLQPMGPREIDEVMATRFDLVGRWANWKGAPAEGARWHVSLHRARPTD